MTTKNEYIASIMLEAADLLKEDASYNRASYSMYDYMCDTLNEAYNVINRLDSVIDYYDNNWYNLNEATTKTTENKIKKAFNFIIDKIKEAWNAIMRFFGGGKKFAKKKGKVTDPKKAADAAEKVVKELNSDNGDVNSVDTDNIEMTVNEGNPAPNYSAAKNKVDKVMREINQSDADLSKKYDAIKVVQKISDNIVRSTKMFGSLEAEYDGSNTYHKDRRSSIDNYPGINNNNGTYTTGKIRELKNRSNSSQGDERMINSRYTGAYERALARNPVSRRMSMNNAVELLYDQAALTEDADELEIILNAIDALEN